MVVCTIDASLIEQTIVYLLEYVGIRQQQSTKATVRRTLAIQRAAEAENEDFDAEQDVDALTHEVADVRKLIADLSEGYGLGVEPASH